MIRWLVRPPTYGGVPAQQSCPLHHPTASVPARYWKTSLHGIQTPTEPFQSRDSQQVHEEDEDSNRWSQIHNLQDTKWHEEVLQPTKNSGSSVQTRRQSLSWHIRYPNYVPLTETLTSTTWPLCSGTVDWTYGLPLETATLNEATPPGVQRSEAYSSPGRPNCRPENGRSPTAHSHRRRSKVGSRGDTRQPLASEKIPVSHQVERIQLWTQFLGVRLQSLCTRTHSGVPSQTPWGSETHPTHRIQQHFSFRVHCSET